MELTLRSHSYRTQSGSSGFIDCTEPVDVFNLRCHVRYIFVYRPTLATR